MRESGYLLESVRGLYKQILRTKRFQIVDGTMEGKHFSDCITGAISHGDAYYGRGNYFIVQADVPNNAPSLITWPNLDRRGPARFLSLEDLAKVKPKPTQQGKQ